MAFASKTLKVFIASPSDLKQERDAAEAAIVDWNAIHAEAKGVVLLPVRWETSVFPVANQRPQTALNQQIVDGADILLGLFWTRLGSNTGVPISGSAVDRRPADLADTASFPCRWQIAARRSARLYRQILGRPLCPPERRSHRDRQQHHREDHRKNSPFAGHHAGAENWATIASLIETCKLNAVELHTNAPRKLVYRNLAIKR